MAMFLLTWVQIAHAVVCLLSILILVCPGRAGLPEFFCSVRLPAPIRFVVSALSLLLLLPQAGRDILHPFLLALLI